MRNHDLTMLQFRIGGGLALLLFCACLPSGIGWADQVLLKNGDRVTGTIVQKDGKNLTIKTDQFGVVTTSWDQVESITAEKPVTVVPAER